MSVISSVYNSVVTFVGEEIVHPAMIGLGYTNDEIADPKIGPTYFHDLADVGDRAHQHYMNGNPVAGFVAANAGVVTATGSAGARAAERGVEAAKDGLVSVFNDTVQNGIWNNLIVALIGAFAGMFAGEFLGSIFGQSLPGPLGAFAGGGGKILGLVGGAAGGWVLGDQIMEGVGINVESKKAATPEIPAPADTGYHPDLAIN